MVAAPLEELITDAVLYRLDTPELAAALTGRSTDADASKVLSEQLGADRAQLDELAQIYAARRITAREWMAARRPIENAITEAERRLGRLTRTDALTGLVGNGTALRSGWAGLNLTRQNAMVAAMLDHVVIAPGTPGSRTLDPARVEPVWRL